MPQVVPFGDRSTAVFAVTCVMLVLATLFVVMRLISKLGLVRRPTWDDAVIVLAWLFAAGMSIAIMYGSTVGLGKQDADILPEWEIPLKRAAYAFTVLYNPALMATKIAILMLYYRIGRSRPFFQYATIFVGVVVILSGIVLTFLNIFRCHPISSAFNTSNAVYVSAERCIDIFSLYLSSAPINILTDISILILPLPLITSMRLEVRAKVGLFLTFLIGVFVTIVDVIRIAYLQEALIREIVDGSITDFAWHASYSLMWSAIEVNVGLICACALVIKPLILRLIPGKSSASLDYPTTFPTNPSTPRQAAVNASTQIGGNDNDFAEMGSHNDPNESMAEKVTALAGPSRINSQEDDLLDAEDNHTMDIIEFFNTADGLLERPLPTELNATERKGRLTSFSMRISNRRSSAKPAFGPIQPQLPPTTFMDFVKLGEKKPLTQLTSREAWWPILFVSTLFWTWGFASSLVGTLNGAIQTLAEYNASRSLALRIAYWVAYFLAPLIAGYWILTRFGFKPTFITGLGVYAVGALAFWPSSVLLSYAGFFISNFMVANGSALLEVAANPFIALAGPEHLMEARLNFSQGLQGIGSVLATLLATRVLFKDVGREALFKTQWVYLAVALWASLLGMCFYYVPLSEASDEDLELVATQRELYGKPPHDQHVWGCKILYLVTITGIFVMWLYVGVQEQLDDDWTSLMQELNPGTTTDQAFNYQLVRLSCFTFARFLGSFACYLRVPGRIVLAVCVMGCLLTSVLSMVLPIPSSSNGALAATLLLSFFSGPIFPTLFAMTLRGCGRYTKRVSTGLTISISGGAVWPSIAWALELSHDHNARYALSIMIGVFAAIFVILLIMNIHPVLRDWVDCVPPVQQARCAEMQAVDGQEANSQAMDGPVNFWEKGPRESDSSPFATGLEHIEFAETKRA